jgi:hypothetical protein
MVKHPDHSALGILNGHNCLVAGTYKVNFIKYLKYKYIKEDCQSLRDILYVCSTL